LSEGATFTFEQLQPSAPPPRDAHEQLLARARAEAERVREQARAEGHAEGLALGREAGIAQVAAATEALGEALRSLHSLRGELAGEIEGDAVELAVALADKVLAGALEARPELVLDTVRGALRRVTERRRITIVVDPGDLELVGGAIEALQTQAGGIELCEVQADRRVGRGGAVVRTAEGEVDASVATQLQRARELLAEGLAAEEPECA
jgi:flagellar biosynthesis/type III secretory pathway protein FliH